jgi:e3 binding domain
MAQKTKPKPKRSAQRRNGDSPAQQALHHETDSDREYRKYERQEEEDRAGPPDVLLDVPELKVDSIHFELDDLDAHVALKARVLNLVKLNAGIDVHLSRVKLDVKGVDAELVLKARLDHVTAIVDRLMTSLDRNPELVKGLSRAVTEVGQGAGQAVDMTGDAAKDVGKGAQSALQDVGKGAGQAVGNLDQVVGGVGQTLGQVGQGAGQALGGAVPAGQQRDQADGQTDGGPPAAGGAGGTTKELAKTVARELGHAASDEARELTLAATRKVRELGERREQRRAEKHNATETAIRVADELGLDLAQIEGTGMDGRVTVKDVRQAQEAS